MSLINKVLRDLDQREVIGSTSMATPKAVVSPAYAGRDWFWRVIAALMLAALAWVAWVAFQLQPRTVATELAFRAAVSQRQSPAQPVQKLLNPPAAVTQPLAQVASAASESTTDTKLGATGSGSSSGSPELAAITPSRAHPAALPAPASFQLARNIDTPIPPAVQRAPVGHRPPSAPNPVRTALERKNAATIAAPDSAGRAESAVRAFTRKVDASAVSKESARFAAVRPPDKASTSAQVEPVEERSAVAKAAASRRGEPVPAGAPAASAERLNRVEKRDRVRSPGIQAEARYRRAAVLLNQGRIGEAEEGFRAAIAINESHSAARQALVALFVEQRRFDEAARLLEEGLALDRENASSSIILARIRVEGGDYDEALKVLRAAGGNAWGDPSYGLLLGAVLQRLGRHEEAVVAYRHVTSSAPGNGAAWMGLGLSLESAGHIAESSEAFHNAISTGTLGPELRHFAQQRAKRSR